MNRKNDAGLAVIKGVRDFMEAHSAEVLAFNMPILITYKGQLAALIEPIQSLAGLTGVATQPVTASKAAARALATEIGVIVRSMLFNYASDHVRPNPDLPASPDNPTDYAMEQLKGDMAILTEGFITTLKDEEVVVYFQNIWDKANDLSTVTPPATSPLIAYGCKNDVGAEGDEDYEPGTLTQFETAIESYATATTSPRAAISDRKTKHIKLKELYRQAYDILAKMDNSFSLLKNVNPELYDGYNNIRVVILPTFATQIVGTVSKVTSLELETTAIAEGAKITMTAAPYLTTKNKQRIKVQPEPIALQTDEEGKYVLPTPDRKSIYTVKCTLPGYENVIKTDIKVKRGEKTQVNFIMLPVQTTS